MLPMESTGLEEMKIFKCNIDFIFIFKRLLIKLTLHLKRENQFSAGTFSKGTSPQKMFLYVYNCKLYLCCYHEILLQSLKAEEKELRQNSKAGFPSPAIPAHLPILRSRELSERLSDYLKLTCDQNRYALGTTSSCSYFCS